MVLFADVQTAVVAKEALEGHCIYDGGFCKLHISYSRHTDLSIKVSEILVGLASWPYSPHSHSYFEISFCLKLAQFV